MPRPRGPDTITYDGDGWFIGNRGYYVSTGRTTRLLHRTIYEAEVAPIPIGWVVHHKDGNKLNNDPANLEAVSRSTHSRLHGTAQHLPRDGRGQRSLWAKRQPKPVVCVGCGATFSSTGMRAMFCSKPCRRRYYHVVRGY